MSETSFVIGNSWQLLDLRHNEKRILDRATFVFACNHFLSHWRTAGFRPTVWAMGDTEDPDGCAALAQELAALASDGDLHKRLRHVFVCCESASAFNVVRESQLPITIYRRGAHDTEEQLFARNLFYPVLHRSTGCDLLNLARILNPTGQIRLAGFNRGGGDGYFYTGRDASSDPEVFFCREMWDAFQMAHESGWDILDCCRHHPKYADLYSIPKGSLL